MTINTTISIQFCLSHYKSQTIPVDRTDGLLHSALVRLHLRPDRRFFHALRGQPHPCDVLLHGLPPHELAPLQHRQVYIHNIIRTGSYPILASLSPSSFSINFPELLEHT